MINQVPVLVSMHGTRGCAPNDGAGSLSSVRVELTRKNWKLSYYFNIYLKLTKHNCVTSFGLLEFD